MFPEFTLRFLADEERSFNTIFFPLICSWTEDVDDGVRGEGKDPGHGGFVAVDDREIQLFIRAQRGRRLLWHVGIICVRFIVGEVDWVVIVLSARFT